MTVRRAPLLAAALAVVSVSAWGQSLTITPTSLPVGGGVFTVNKAIPLQQLGVAPPFQNDLILWSISSGNLPPGLSLSGAASPPGSIAGTPTQAGAFTFTVMAVDNQAPTPQQAFQQYTLFVSTGAPLTLTPLTHPSGALGGFYSGLLFQASGGVPGYTWALQRTTNSDGLLLDPNTGFLTGNPQAGGIFPIGVIVTDASGAQATASNNLDVLGITTAALPNGTIGIAYSQPLAAIGNTGSLSWSLLSGVLPPGLNLSPQGQIAGTPTTGGTFPFQVSVTDIAAGVTTSRSLSIIIPAILTITTTTVPSGTVGIPYSPPALAATGGSGPLNWSSVSGNLPPGISLSAQGLITGTPTQAGPFTFQVRATDPVTNLNATQSLSINVTAPLLVSTISLANGTIGIAYSQTLQATGGTPPYSWSATGQPAGLALDPNTGILNGTPTAPGASAISITLTDAARGSASLQLTLTIGTPGIAPAALPSGFINVPYSSTLAVVGATIANWAVTTGTLPAGLNLNPSTGVISGTPTVAGTSPFTITASFGSVTAVVPPIVQSFTIVINALTITGLPQTGVAGTQPSATLSLSGGTYPLNITGTMTLTFAPASGGSQLYDAKFASGAATTATFTIAAGSSQGLFSTTPFTSIPVMIGTVAGNIKITTSLQDSAGNPLPPPAPVVIAVIPTVPVISKVTIGTVTTSGFSISVTGRSTPRDMTSALFHFTSPTNTQLASADVTVPLSSAFAGWYGSSASIPLGSTFTVTVQFTYTGPPGTTVPFTAVTITLTNSVGASAVFGPVNP